MYAEFAEPVKSLAEKKASHRYLAMRRGWAEEELTVAVEGDEAANLQLFERTTFVPAVEKAVAGNAEIGKVLEFLKTCAKLAYTVHVHPSISNEVHRV
jgi:uncharacterized protein